MSTQNTIDLYLSSDYRDNGSPHDFDTNLYQVWPGDDSQMIKLESWNIPNICPIFQDKWNNSFILLNVTTQVPTTITLTGVEYTLDSLLADLKLKIEAVTGVGTTFNSATTASKASYTCWLSGAAQTWALVASTDTHRRFFKRLGMLDVLLSKQQVMQISFATVAAAETYYGKRFYPQLAHRYIDVCTNLSTSAFTNEKGSMNVLKRIFVENTPYGSMVPVQSAYESATVMHAHSNTLQRFRLFLLTDEGVPFVLPEWSTVAYHFSVSSAYNS